MNRKYELSALANVPISPAVMATLFPDIKAINKKVAALECSGDIVRVKKGLYVVNPELTGRPVSTELIANHLYSPSYISMHTALRYYGLIPEAVYSIESMTTKHSRRFSNSFGHFNYTQTSREAFSIGLTTETTGPATFVIATPEKALCDLIAHSTDVCLRYKNETLQYLEHDIRFDMDYLPQLRKPIFEQYLSVGKKARSIETLLKLL